MKRLLTSFLIIGLCTVVGGFLGWNISSTQDTSRYFETTVFATVLSSDTNSSVEEKETASHFFAEAVLGWTLSPAFTGGLDFDFSSRKQERGNIIFEITSSTKKEADMHFEAFTNALEQKLQQYNAQANTQFSLLMDPPQTTEKIPQKSYYTMAGIIIGFFIGLILVEMFSLLVRWRRRG